MDTIIDINATPRKLASIQIIDTVSSIDGADRIEVSTMKNLGWFCVTKKGEVKPGDKVVYFEVDSILPEKSEFEFLREGKFRIKTRKFKKQVSEGLIIPIPDDLKNLDVGSDVTVQMGVKRYNPQAQEEAELIVPTHRSPVMQYLMKFKLARNIYFAFNTVDKSEWPSFAASKTDEERLATCAKRLMENYDKTWYISEKLDGCLDANVMVQTEDGILSMKEICETEYKGKIAAFDMKKNRLVNTKITHHSIKDNNDDWYEIKYEDSFIKLTGEHLVWLPEQNCYREVKNLKETDRILIID